MPGGVELDVYTLVQADVLTDEFLILLKQKWTDVACLLKELRVGEIAEFDVLEISLLDDGEMARIHGEFLDDPTPTDVITFEHGELLIGVETAIRQAEEFHSSAAREIALYGIHGMLHLSGFDDKKPDLAEVMTARQFELLTQFFPQL